VHQPGIVFAGKEVPAPPMSAASGYTVIEAAVDDRATGALVLQVDDDKVVSLGFPRIREPSSPRRAPRSPSALAV
jgi:hypothetical protein